MAQHDGQGSRLVTCEHAVNRVPAPYASLFVASGRQLQTHHAYDRGARELARVLSQRLGATLVAGTVTRLLVDLNRSLHNRSVLSRFSQQLDAHGRRNLLDRYYHPYRLQVESLVSAAVNCGQPVRHVSVHSFTPVLRSRVRRADIGLLYDPNRGEELRLCRSLQDALTQLRPDLVVRRNYPYRGTSDGMTSYLRRRFGPHQYVGIELEVNQRWPRKDREAWHEFQRSVTQAFLNVIQSSQSADL